MLETIEAGTERIVMGRLSEFGTLALTHPDLVGLHAMWDALRGDRPVPFRAELDAGRIGAKAPFLAILEYVGPSNFRIRIAGDRLNRWFGLELRGMSALSMVAAQCRNHVQAALNRVTGEPAVAALQGEARTDSGFAAPFEMALLPMRSDFGRVDRVLVGMWLTDGRALAPAPLRILPERITLAPIADGEAAMDAALSVAPEAPAERSPPTVADPSEPAAQDDAAADRAARTRAAAAEPMVKEPGRRGHLRLVKKD